jgi:hypothetical protein
MCLLQAFMDMQEPNVGATWKKARKGKIIVADKEKQLYQSMLHVSQDPIIGTEQKNQAF